MAKGRRQVRACWGSLGCSPPLVHQTGLQRQSLPNVGRGQRRNQRTLKKKNARQPWGSRNAGKQLFLKVGCRLLLQLWNQLKRSAQSLVFSPPAWPCSQRGLTTSVVNAWSALSMMKRSCGCFRRGWAGTTGKVNDSGHSSSCSLCRDSPPKSSTASRASCGESMF